jgi:HSP20 family molecular chaperone IbpA
MHTINSISDFFSGYYSTTGLTSSGGWFVDSPKQSITWSGETVDAFLKQFGTPWDSVDAKFPPFDVMVNKKSGELKFRFALSGVDPDTVSVEFSDDRLWLLIDEQKEEDVSEWDILKQKIKRSVNGRYYYPVSTERFNVEDANGQWNKGVLEITIPLNKEKRPHKLKITK